MKPGVRMKDYIKIIKELQIKNEVNINDLLEKLVLSEKEFEEMLLEIKKLGIKVIDIKKDNKNLEVNLSEISSTLKIYYSEINKYHILTKEEEDALIKKYREGSIEARNLVICSNLKLVISIANKYKDKIKNKHITFQDIIGEGNFGLFHALERYDADKGCKFSTYAAYWIHQKIYRSIENYGDIIRKPIGLHEKIKRIQKFRYEYKVATTKDATIEICAQNTGYSTLEVKNIMQILETTQNVYSLDEYIDSDEKETCFIDTVSDKRDYYMEMEEKQNYIYILETIKEILTPYEYEIVFYRNCLPDGQCKRLEDLSKKYGISKERIRQVETRALRKCRIYFQNKKNDEKRNDSNVEDINKTKVKRNRKK